MLVVWRSTTTTRNKLLTLHSHGSLTLNLTIHRLLLLSIVVHLLTLALNAANTLSQRSWRVLALVVPICVFTQVTRRSLMNSSRAISEWGGLIGVLGDCCGGSRRTVVTYETGWVGCMETQISVDHGVMIFEFTFVRTVHANLISKIGARFRELGLIRIHLSTLSGWDTSSCGCGSMSSIVILFASLRKHNVRVWLLSSISCFAAVEWF